MILIWIRTRTADAVLWRRCYAMMNGRCSTGACCVVERRLYLVHPPFHNFFTFPFLFFIFFFLSLTNSFLFFYFSNACWITFANFTSDEAKYGKWEEKYFFVSITAKWCSIATDKKDLHKAHRHKNKQFISAEPQKECTEIKK